MIEIVFSGVCEQCPYSELKFSVDRTSYSYPIWDAECVHERYCKRVYNLRAESMEELCELRKKECGDDKCQK